MTKPVRDGEMAPEQQLYPHPTGELTARRKQLDPETAAAFHAFSKSVFQEEPRVGLQGVRVQIPGRALPLRRLVCRVMFGMSTRVQSRPTVSRLVR